MLNVLKRVPFPFRRLQWRLTFSYILITAIALLVTIVVATLVLVQFVINQYPQNAVSALTTEAPTVLDDLQQPNNQQSLTSDIGDVAGNMLVGYTDPNTGLSAIIPTQDEYTAIIDPHGRVLVSDDTQRMPQGSSFSERVSPLGREVVLLSTHNNAKPTPVVKIDQKQVLYGAVSLFNGRRQLVGTLLTVQYLPTYNQVIIALFPLLWPTLAFITCIVGLIGVLFGSILSRWLVRRFKRVSTITESWSQGDFSSMISDRSQDELGVMTRQLNTMASKLEQLLYEQQNIAVLEERHRMARDLHDSLKQQLFAILMQVWGTQALLDSHPAEAKERLGTTAQQLGQVQQELSTLIYQLRPVHLVDKRFPEALRDYCEQWARQHHITPVLEIADVDLSLQAEEALFRIAQEALANVAHHSYANTVQVRLVDEETQVVLSIIDNGWGFHPEQVSQQGLGLQSMRERMEKLQGTLSITSAPGDGTHICATYIKGQSSRLQHQAAS